MPKRDIYDFTHVSQDVQRFLTSAMETDNSKFSDATFGREFKKNFNLLSYAQKKEAFLWMRRNNRDIFVEKNFIEHLLDAREHKELLVSIARDAVKENSGESHVFLEKLRRKINQLVAGCEDSVDRGEYIGARMVLSVLDGKQQTSRGKYIGASTELLSQVQEQFYYAHRPSLGKVEILQDTLQACVSVRPDDQAFMEIEKFRRLSQGGILKFKWDLNDYSRIVVINEGGNEIDRLDASNDSLGELADKCLRNSLLGKLYFYDAPNLKSIEGRAPYLEDLDFYRVPDAGISKNSTLLDNAFLYPGTPVRSFYNHRPDRSDDYKFPSYTGIEELDFDNYPNLWNVNLTHCRRLKTIRGKSDSVRSLDVSDTAVEDLDLGKWSNLERLILGSRKLKKLVCPPKLQVLYLPKADLSELKLDLSKAEALRKIVFPRLEKSLPKIIEPCPTDHAVELDFGPMYEDLDLDALGELIGASFSRMPKTLRPSTRLRNLDLSGHDLRKINLAGFSALEKFKASGNKSLRSIEGFAPRLREIDVSHNPNLNKLPLPSNALESFPELRVLRTVGTKISKSRIPEDLARKLNVVGILTQRELVDTCNGRVVRVYREEKLGEPEAEIFRRLDEKYGVHVASYALHEGRDGSYRLAPGGESGNLLKQISAKDALFTAKPDLSAVFGEQFAAKRITLEERRSLLQEYYKDDPRAYTRVFLALENKEHRRDLLLNTAFFPTLLKSARFEPRVLELAGTRSLWKRKRSKSSVDLGANAPGSDDGIFVEALEKLTVEFSGADTGETHIRETAEKALRQNRRARELDERWNKPELKKTLKQSLEQAYENDDPSLLEAFRILSDRGAQSELLKSSKALQGALGIDVQSKVLIRLPKGFKVGKEDALGTENYHSIEPGYLRWVHEQFGNDPQIRKAVEKRMNANVQSIRRSLTLSEDDALSAHQIAQSWEKAEKHLTLRAFQRHDLLDKQLGPRFGHLTSIELNGLVLNGQGGKALLASICDSKVLPNLEQVRVEACKMLPSQSELLRKRFGDRFYVADAKAHEKASNEAWNEEMTEGWVKKGENREVRLARQEVLDRIDSWQKDGIKYVPSEVERIPLRSLPSELLHRIATDTLESITLNECALQGSLDVSPLSEAPKLKTLVITGNKELTEIWGLEKLTNLEKLDVRGNGLKGRLTLPNAPETLKEVYLGRNELTGVGGLEKLRVLETLDASDNDIERFDLSAFADAKELKKVVLSNTSGKAKLTSLGGFEALINEHHDLESINVEGQALTSVPPPAYALRRGKVKLGDNPIDGAQWDQWRFMRELQGEEECPVELRAEGEGVESKSVHPSRLTYLSGAARKNREQHRERVGELERKFEELRALKHERIVECLKVCPEFQQDGKDAQTFEKLKKRVGALEEFRKEKSGTASQELQTKKDADAADIDGWLRMIKTAYAEESGKPSRGDLARALEEIDALQQGEELLKQSKHRLKESYDIGFELKHVIEASPHSKEYYEGMQWALSKVLSAADVLQPLAQEGEELDAKLRPGDIKPDTAQSLKTASKLTQVLKAVFSNVPVASHLAEAMLIGMGVYSDEVFNDFNKSLAETIDKDDIDRFSQDVARSAAFMAMPHLLKEGSVEIPDDPYVNMDPWKLQGVRDAGKLIGALASQEALGVKFGEKPDPERVDPPFTSKMATKAKVFGKAVQQGMEAGKNLVEKPLVKMELKLERSVQSAQNLFQPEPDESAKKEEWRKRRDAYRQKLRNKPLEYEQKVRKATQYLCNHVHGKDGDVRYIDAAVLCKPKRDEVETDILEISALQGLENALQVERLRAFQPSRENAESKTDVSEIKNMVQKTVEGVVTSRYEKTNEKLNTRMGEMSKNIERKIEEQFDIHEHPHGHFARLHGDVRTLGDRVENLEDLSKSARSVSKETTRKANDQGRSIERLQTELGNLGGKFNQRSVEINETIAQQRDVIQGYENTVQTLREEVTREKTKRWNVKEEFRKQGFDFEYSDGEREYHFPPSRGQSKITNYFLTKAMSASTSPPRSPVIKPRTQQNSSMPLSLPIPGNYPERNETQRVEEPEQSEERRGWKEWFSSKRRREKQKAPVAQQNSQEASTSANASSPNNVTQEERERRTEEWNQSRDEDRIQNFADTLLFLQKEAMDTGDVNESIRFRTTILEDCKKSIQEAWSEDLERVLEGKGESASPILALLRRERENRQGASQVPRGTASPPVGYTDISSYLEQRSHNEQSSSHVSTSRGWND